MCKIWKVTYLIEMNSRAVLNLKYLFNSTFFVCGQNILIFSMNLSYRYIFTWKMHFKTLINSLSKRKSGKLCTKHRKDANIIQVQRIYFTLTDSWFLRSVKKDKLSGENLN